MSGERRRVSVGFQGSQVLPLRLTQDKLDGLREALRGGQGGWHEVEGEDGAVLLNLNAVVFLRVDAEEQRIGF
ncbi:MAG: hypothetical protein ACLGI3_07395 [Actinomycetes bacterium]